MCGRCPTPDHPPCASHCGSSRQYENLPVIMFDDVVMSIDAQHRRPRAPLLKDRISPKHQLIITTHNKLWYQHLKTVGLLHNVLFVIVFT
jgi:recombinational DNA repair ATPase RecF